MPELPDVNLYKHSLDRLLAGFTLNRLIIKSPFLLRTFDPAVDQIEGLRIEMVSHLEKKLLWHFERDYTLVFHLMVAGRYHWRKPGRMPTQRNDLAAFQFDHGTMMLTEASQNKRAAMYLVQGDDSIEQFRRGGIDVLKAEWEDFSTAIKKQNRTVKRALTDPTICSGIGNAYSDEILHAARLSPLKRTQSLSDEDVKKLHQACVDTLTLWMERLIEQTGDKFPEKVTAFRPDMAVHGKFNEPCPICATNVQRIRYAENECNYCPRCQTGGKLLADRSLSRLLKSDWPKTIDELEE